MINTDPSGFSKGRLHRSQWVLAQLRNPDVRTRVISPSGPPRGIFPTLGYRQAAQTSSKPAWRAIIFHSSIRLSSILLSSRAVVECK